MQYATEESGERVRQWYRDTYGDVEPDVAPHCDSDVLHAPGECVYCDCHPKRQAQREAEGVNFTGHHDTAKAMCPSEVGRPLERIELWAGNRPIPDTDIRRPLRRVRRVQSLLRRLRGV
jgi:hypothetical protein